MTHSFLFQLQLAILKWHEAPSEANAIALNQLLEKIPMPVVKIKLLDPEAKIPEYTTPGAACFDLVATGIEWTKFDGTQAVFKTGLAFEIPEDYVMLIFSRSGHGFRQGIRLANCVGVIDSDYRGEVKVKLVEDQGGCDLHQLRVGDRIAQALLVEIPAVAFMEVDQLGETSRGGSGFGSTGNGRVSDPVQFG